MAQAGDRILAQDVQLTLVAESGTLGGLNPRIMAEIDKFDAQWVPDINKTWPSGSKHQRQQLTGGSYKVSMEAAQVSGGFLALGKAQHDAVKAGKTMPKVRCTRTAHTADGQTFRETYIGGVVSDAKNSQSEGNKPAMSSCTIDFEDMI